MKDKGSEKEQITHATMGSGNITVGGESNPDLEGLNRDVSVAQEITKDKITGALDGSMTIDNRVFSGEGWNDIIKQHEEIGDNLVKTLKDASVAFVNVGAIGVGVVEAIAGYVFNSDNTDIIIDRDNNKIVFTGGIIGSSIFNASGAITFGNIQIYYNDSNPYEIVYPYGYHEYGAMPLEYHENGHMEQWHRDGALKFVWNWISGGGPTISNPSEQEASSIGRNNLMKEGVYDKIQENYGHYYKRGTIW